MKLIIKNILTITFLIITFTCVPGLVQAGPDDPGCDPLDPACPIDGGLGLLLAAGIGYGIKKVRDTKKNTYQIQDKFK